MIRVVTWKKIITILFAIFLVMTSSVHRALASEQSDSLKKDSFLSLSDIHFDPFVACYKIKEKPCPLIVKLRKSPVNQWAKILSVYDTSLSMYHHDTNYRLLMTLLSDAKKTSKNKQIKFVLVLGDFLGHDFRRYYKKYSLDKSSQGYQAFVKNTLAFLAIQIDQAFPSVDVYLVVGNNDTYHSDYSSDPNGSFFHDTGDLWSGLIRDKHNRQIMKHDFSTAGYYAIDVSAQKNLRLIVLNSVLFSYKAKGNGVTDAANAELEWLDKQLATASGHHQKVIIAMHIPAGVDIYLTEKIHLFTLMHLWNVKYATRFKSLLQQYSAEIIGVFSGHLHSDWDQTLSFDELSNKILLSGTPPVSPIYGNKPGYKIYSFSVDPLQLYESDAYYSSLLDTDFFGK